jgi:hypothetical protein
VDIGGKMTQVNMDEYMTAEQVKAWRILKDNAAVLRKSK